MTGGLHREVHCVLGLPFDALDATAVVERVRDAASRRRRCFLSTPNLNFLIGSRADAGFRDSVINSDLSIADGMPLIWVARLLGIPLRERVAGSSLFERLREACSPPLKVYFFGGPPGVAEIASRRLNEAPGGLVCVGHESPGFGSVGELSSGESIARINASGADLLVVSLGAKKGQAWIEHNRARIAVPAITHLGAVVNFVAGTVRRAPGWMQRAGLEWTWRIKEEPGLWRRYLSDGLGFLWLLLTRVAPNAWLAYRNRSAAAGGGETFIGQRRAGREVLVRLRGAWSGKAVPALRDCLSKAIAAGNDVRIDLARVSYVDSAFLGLLLLAYGAQKRQGKRLVCEAASAKVRRLFRYACSEFLLESDEDIAALDLQAADLESLELEP